MSVLIKNMEMPSRCFDCHPFAKWSNLHQTKACNCGSYYFKPCFEDYSEEFYEKRADFCPLVEVSVPHGRLIEVTDELLTALSNFIAETGIDEVPYMSASDWIEMNAPTVIEAEGTE